MIEFDIYLSDDSHYDEKSFKNLLKAYHNNELLDNTIELTSIALNLGYDNFSNEEVVDMDSINTIEKMQKLLITLKDIDVLIVILHFQMLILFPMRIGPLLEQLSYLF